MELAICSITEVAVCSQTGVRTALASDLQGSCSLAAKTRCCCPPSPAAIDKMTLIPAHHSQFLPLSLELSPILPTTLFIYSSINPFSFKQLQNKSSFLDSAVYHLQPCGLILIRTSLYLALYSSTPKRHAHQKTSPRPGISSLPTISLRNLWWMSRTAAQPIW